MRLEKYKSAIRECDGLPHQIGNGQIFVTPKQDAYRVLLEKARGDDKLLMSEFVELYKWAYDHEHEPIGYTTMI